MNSANSIEETMLPCPILATNGQDGLAVDHGEESGEWWTLERRIGDVEELLGGTRSTELDERSVHSPSDGLRVSRQKLLKRITTYRSEEHTSELQSLMRNSYAVFCLKQTK